MGVNKFLGCFFLSFVFVFCGQTLASENNSLFKNGDLNPMYMGRAATLIAEVKEVKKGPGNKDFYKIDVRRKGVKPIWVSTYAPMAEGAVKVGDRLKFIGHVRKVEDLDPSGKLEEFVQSSALLVARSIQTLK